MTDWRYAKVEFQVGVAPGTDFGEAIDDLRNEIEEGVQATRLDYTEIEITEVDKAMSIAEEGR